MRIHDYTPISPHPAHPETLTPEERRYMPYANLPPLRLYPVPDYRGSRSTATSYNNIPYSPYPYESVSDDGNDFPSAQRQLVDNPMVREAAKAYGTKIMDTGVKMVDEKLSQLNQIRFYFAVDTHYVIHKLWLILFPFYHRPWAPKQIQFQPEEPKSDINAIDLYIPLMAYITYVLTAGFMIAKRSTEFGPEILGMLATQALGYYLIELALLQTIKYVAYLKTTISTWDIVGLLGYKFVGMIVALLMDELFGRLGYYLSLIYCGLAIAFFSIRTFRWRMVDENAHHAAAYTKNHGPFDTQKKRQFYFLILVGILQPVLMWWLSYHLQSYTNYKFYTPS